MSLLEDGILKVDSTIYPKWIPLFNFAFFVVSMLMDLSGPLI